MKLNALILLLLVATAACAHTSNQSSTDSSWEFVARSLQSLAAEGKESPVIDSELKRLSPTLVAQLDRDAKNVPLQALWGQSINYDEYAKGVIVDPAILRALGDRMKIQTGPLDIFYNKPGHISSAIRQESISERSIIRALKREVEKGPRDAAGHAIAHAGLEHTYGYLLSTLKTAYGYKRARWVEGQIERGMSLPDGLLGPQSPEGTLFQNATLFFGRIAFRADAEELGQLIAASRELPRAIRDYRYADLSVTRILETVGTTTLRTDLVAFNKPQKDTHLLIYSIADSSNGGARLITAFPVKTDFVESLLKKDRFGKNQSIQTRYNAYVEDLSGKSTTGERTLSP